MVHMTFACTRRTSVIAGHYDWMNNILAIFSHLHELRKGDKISVEDENGMIAIFVVREIRTYNEPPRHKENGVSETLRRENRID